MKIQKLTLNKIFTSLIIGICIVGALVWLKNNPEGEKTLIPDLNINLSGKSKDSGDLNTFKHSSGEFSFKYSSTYKVSSTSPEEGQEIINTEDESGKGFQIFIIPFDESGPITKERILEDIPDMEINNLGKATLDKVETLVFNSSNEDIGETFEVWVINKGKLYQIMAQKDQEKSLIQILET